MWQVQGLRRPSNEETRPQALFGQLDRLLLSNKPSRCSNQWVKGAQDGKEKSERQLTYQVTLLSHKVGIFWCRELQRAVATFGIFYSCKVVYLWLADVEGSLMGFKYVGENKMINFNKYCSLLDQLKAALNKKLPELVIENA